VLELAKQAHAGVVDEDVEPARQRRAGLLHGGAALGACYVRHDGLMVVAQLAGERLQRRRAAAHQQQAHAGAGQRLRHRAADAAAGAGQQRRLAVQLHGVPLRSIRRKISPYKR
jgi:predicted ABC-type transport system involved in lysophospholipase L1 biosynthesis ATPase subunit